MNPVKIEPTCRYGHGPLLGVTKMDGAIPSFGVAMILDNVVENPNYLTGFRFYVCTKCGYSELFDSDVSKTIQNMEKTHG